MENCHGFSAHEEKFSLSMSISVAAASKPTTPGRSPKKMCWTTGVFMYFMNIRAMTIIMMNDGSTSAKVATAEPSVDIIMP